MNNLHAILIECDNIRSLGESCERDVYNIHKMLITNNVPESNIHILTNNVKYFSKKNMTTNIYSNSRIVIENILKILTITENPIFIHISGHGYQGADVKNIELDGRCEQIVLSDGVLRDYEFNTLLKKYIKKTIRLRISVDTCHSGTFSNFYYKFDTNNKKIPAIKNSTPYFTDACSISACADNQLDSCDIGLVGGFGGGLTSHILDDNNLINFLIGDIIKVKENLLKILRLLSQEPILLVDN